MSLLRPETHEALPPFCERFERPRRSAPATGAAVAVLTRTRPPRSAPPETDREDALARLFELHHRRLLKLAVLLGAGPDAEDLVAEAFYELGRRWTQLRTTEAAVSYLRSIVCNLTRMRHRHLKTVRRHEQRSTEEYVLSAEHQVILRDDQRAVIAALQTLSARQRQALVLRYWLGLSEAEIARTMDITPGAVKSHVFRGMAKLEKIFKGPDREQ